ncbi:MAG: radical SAM protein [Clostridia bacterium]|nr:radical SAM protein [Clostridia bacterium]
MKTSLFNIILDDGGALMLFNSMRGLNSLCKVSENCREKVLGVLNGTVEDKEIEDILIDCGYLVDDNCDEKMKQELLYSYINSGNILRLILLPTEQCNFRCKYCYEDYKRGEMSIDIQDSIIKYVQKNIQNFSALRVSWFGGEPLMSMKAIEYLSEKLMTICKKTKRKYISDITTNGYLLTEDVFRKLLSYNVLEYQITIDGTKEIHDSKKPLINGKGTFDVVTNNLKTIHEKIKSNMFHIIIRSNVTEDACESMESFTSFFKDMLNDDKRFSFFLRPVGDWGGNVKFDEMCRKRIEEDEIKLVYNNFIKGGANFKISTHESFYYTGGCVCYAGYKDSFVIDAEGGVRKCTCGLDDPDYRVGRMLPNGTMEIDEDKHSRWVGNTVRFSEKCSSCSFSPLCFGFCCPRSNQYECENEEQIRCPSEKKYLLETLKFIEASGRKIKYIC